MLTQRRRSSAWLMRRVRWFAFAGSVVLVAGCGSTVRIQPGRANQASGLGLPTPGASRAGVPGGGVPVSGSTSSGSSSSTVAGGLGGLGGGVATAAPGKPVEIGFLVDNSAQTNAFVKSVAPQVSTADNAAAMRALVRYVNANGGLAGHQIQPVIHEMNIAGSDTYSSEYQKACADFTQDHHVFAVVGIFVFPGWQSFATCLAQRKVPWITEYPGQLFSPQELKQFAPYLYAPPSLGGARFGVYIDMLHDAGYFNPTAKVGLVYVAQPAASWTVDHVLKPRLAHFGHPVAVEHGFTPASSTTQGASDNAAAVQNGIVRFREAGVDHVICFATNGNCNLWMEAAEAQQYRPRYATSSLEGLATVSQIVPKAQLQGALAMGWLPTFDVGEAQRPPATAAVALCEKIVQSSLPSYFWDCDGVFFLRLVANRAGELSVGALATAAGGLGSAFQSPMTFTTWFGPGRVDGVSSVRLLAFNSGCGCFAYQGGLRRAP